MVRVANTQLGECLTVSSFTSTLTVPVSQLEPRALRVLLESGSAKALYEADFEFAPFFCPQCDRCYCGNHWRRRDVFDDDGWHDSIRGVCPEGHERMLED